MTRLRRTGFLAFLVSAVLAGACSAATSAWRGLPSAPIAPADHTSVWTGKQMLVFGRHLVTSLDAHGNPYVTKVVNVAAAYDPAARAWRQLTPPEETSGGGGGPRAVWTGKQLLVWTAFQQLAYVPATDSWRKLPHAPTTGALAVWTGRKLIGWGGGCCGDAFSAGSAYDPAANRWRKLARSPLAGSQHPVGAWTGRRLLVVVGAFDAEGKPWPARLARAAAYDPARNAWRRLAPLPTRANPTTAVWDGHALLVLVQGGGFALDPVTNAWRAIAPQRLGGSVDAVWTGSRLLVSAGRATRAYDPRTNRWTRLPDAPLPRGVDATPVWTGRSLVVWGSVATKPWGTYRAVGAALAPAR